MDARPSDRELIQRYVRDADEDAFSGLVRRYAAVVRSAAMRQTRGDPALADDVTQATMIVLARRAREIADDVILASWLFTVAHHIAQNALKTRSRRTFHERLAAIRRPERQLATDASNGDLRDELDAAIARLPHIERGGVVLHFFNELSHAQVGEALGLSADAARQRVRRALGRLREILIERGVTVSEFALARSLRSSPATVSERSLSSTIGVALLSVSQDTAPISRSTALANGVGRTATLAKWKLAASIALVVGGFAGVAALPLPGPHAAATGLISQTAPTTAPSGSAVQITPDIRLEFLGSSPHPGDATTWFSIDGQPIEMPDEHLTDNQLNTDSRPDRQVALLLKAPRDVEASLSVDQTFTNSTSRSDIGRGTRLLRVHFGLSDPAPETLSISINFALSDWKTVARCDDLKEEKELDGGDYGPFTVKPPEHSARWGTHIDVRHRPLNVIGRMIATDDQGKEHAHSLINRDNYGVDETITSFMFKDLPPEKIRSIVLQLREFDKRVEITGIAIEPNQHTEPKIQVTDLKREK